MLDTSGSAPLRIEPGPSAALAAGLAGTHAGAGVVVLTLPLVWELQLCLAALILVGLGEAIRLHLLRLGGTAVRSAEWRGGDEWWVRGGDGAVETARLHASTLVLPRLVVLRLSTGALRIRTLVLPSDSLSAGTHRRLRALLLSAGQARGA